MEREPSSEQGTQGDARDVSLGAPAPEGAVPAPVARGASGSTAAALLSRVPLKFLIGFVVLSLCVGEWFPLSHYPMYAKPDDSQWYVYVTDMSDRPVALKTSFGLRTSFLKKMYRNLEPTEGERAVQSVLDYVYRESSKSRAPAPDGLRLWRTDLQIQGKHIVRKSTLLGEYRRP